MGKNKERNRKVVTTTPQNKKFMIAFRSIICIAFVFVVASTVIYLMEIGSETRSYYSMHFALPIVLLFVGIIAVMLSLLSKMSISGESKGDNMMIGVGIALAICAIITLIYSFL